MALNSGQIFRGRSYELPTYGVNRSDYRMAHRQVSAEGISEMHGLLLRS